MRSSEIYFVFVGFCVATTTRELSFHPTRMGFITHGKSSRFGRWHSRLRRRAHSQLYTGASCSEHRRFGLNEHQPGNLIEVYHCSTERIRKKCFCAYDGTCKSLAHVSMMELSPYENEKIEHITLKKGHFCLQNPKFWLVFQSLPARTLIRKCL